MNKAFGILLSCLIFLLACQDKKKPSDETKKITKDTNAIVEPETSSNPYATIDVSPMDMS